MLLIIIGSILCIAFFAACWRWSGYKWNGHDGWHDVNTVRVGYFSDPNDPGGVLLYSVFFP